VVKQRSVVTNAKRTKWTRSATNNATETCDKEEVPLHADL